MLRSLEDYLADVRVNAPQVNAERLARAYEFGKEAHTGQFRKDGVTEYFNHPIEVSTILSEVIPDEDSIVAALLHDTIEDTQVTREDVEAAFGADVLRLVEGVTKLANVTFETKKALQAESMRKMLIAMSSDFRVILIKLADRMHNMRTLMHMSENRQKDIAEETLNIYAPIAHRLGIFRIKWELEDLCLKYLDPEGYRDIVEKVNKKLSEREAVIRGYISQLKEAMAMAGIECEIYGRPKNFYSIYRKMRHQHKEFDEIYDLTAIRIIVKKERDLYAALGVVHSMWNFIPGRFKDYVSTPKNNIYRSLHTTLMGKNEPFEIQIRTEEMHEEAEYGFAAHWRYKEGTLNKHDDFDLKIQCFRRIMDLQGDINEAGEFIDAFQNDILNTEVYVFTPNAEVVDLPEGSTPIDFAYQIHTAVGNSAIGARVDGKSVPLSYVLQNGQVVEIKTSKASQGPSRDWLKFVKTNQAKQKIRQFFKRERRDDNIKNGHSILVSELKKHGFKSKEVLTNDFMQSIYERLSMKSLDDLYNAIGYGGILTSQVVPRVREKFKAAAAAVAAAAAAAANTANIGARVNHKAEVREKARGGVIVRGMEDIFVRFAKCCTPVPGDAIIGYITRGRGVTVHRADCSNFERKEGFDERLIDVEWASTDSGRGAYNVALRLVAGNRKGVVAEITSTLTSLDIDLSSVDAKLQSDDTVHVIISFEIEHRNEMDTLFQRLKSIPDVLSVSRVSS